MFYEQLKDGRAGGCIKSQTSAGAVPALWVTPLSAANHALPSSKCLFSDTLNSQPTQHSQSGHANIMA